MKKILSTIAVFMLVLVVKAQNEDSIFIRRLADEILMNGKAYDNLRVLTKQIGNRLSGSPQMLKAEQWGLNLFRSLNPDNAWLQQCLVPHWVRGGKDEASAFYGKQKRMLDVIALGNSLGSGKNGIRANVIEIKSFDELELKNDQVKGKIVFYNYPFNSKFVKTFQAYGDAVRYRSIGASQAAKYGAVAVIVRSMSGSTDNNPHTGSLRYDSAYKMIPAIAIGLKDAEWLSSQLGRGEVSMTFY